MCVALTAKGFPPNGEVFSVTLVQKLASVPIFELRVFRSKNSIELLDRMENLKSVKRILSSPVDKYSVKKSLKRLRLNEAWSQFFCFEI